MNEKTALITGAASGIGKKTAFMLAEKGFHLVINYRNSEEAAIQLAKKLTVEYGTKNVTLHGDIAKKTDCETLVESALSTFAAIDVLIHNAGPYIHDRKKVADYTFEEWNYLLNGNLTSVFYLTKLLLPSMREKKWGRIITMGFDRAESAPGWIYRSAFGAAKTGLVSLTRTIALEEAANGITANMVCPGDIINEWKERDIVDSLEFAKEISSIGRVGTGEDIARMITFLVDEKSDYITGSVIPVTGGMDVLGKVRLL